jgi:hypothetical protein
MLVETLIKDSATWLTPVPEFHLASMDWFNDTADEATPSGVFLLMENITPSHPKITVQGVTEETFDVVLFFLHNYPKNDVEDFNHNPEYGGVRHIAVDNMRRLATDLLQTLVKDTRLFKPTEDIISPLIKSVYNFLNANLDGVQLTFSLRIISGPSTCAPKHDGAKPAP